MGMRKRNMDKLEECKCKSLLNGHTTNCQYSNRIKHANAEPFMDIDGARRWRNKLGQIHREDGPAVEYLWGPQKGDKFWCMQGKRHRADGPAVERGDHKEWWINGQRHREEGPAIESDIMQGWYWHGKNLSREEFVI